MEINQDHHIRSPRRTDNPVPEPMHTAKGNDKLFCIILPLSLKAHSLKLPAMDKSRPSLSGIIPRALVTSDPCGSPVSLYPMNARC